MQNLFLS